MQKVKKALQENVAKHISPLNKKGSDNIFYLVEGDSAKNNFQPTRDKQRHGMYHYVVNLLILRNVLH